MKDIEDHRLGRIGLKWMNFIQVHDLVAGFPQTSNSQNGYSNICKCNLCFGPSESGIAWTPQRKTSARLSDPSTTDPLSASPNTRPQ